jgi:hypothetical protein
MNMREFKLTNEDDAIFYDLYLGDDVCSPAYEYHISDRNDYAVMRALMSASAYGCRATAQRMAANIGL